MTKIKHAFHNVKRKCSNKLQFYLVGNRTIKLQKPEKIGVPIIREKEVARNELHYEIRCAVCA